MVLLKSLCYMLVVYSPEAQKRNHSVCVIWNTVLLCIIHCAVWNKTTTSVTNPAQRNREGIKNLEFLTTVPYSPNSGNPRFLFKIHCKDVSSEWRPSKLLIMARLETSLLISVGSRNSITVPFGLCPTNCLEIHFHQIHTRVVNLITFLWNIKHS